MKKTTMRIVGFLLAAAALVFVTGCPQPESAKKPEVKPAPQFDYSKLKNTKWMVYSFMDTDHATIGNKGYFFAFDNKAVPELRVAYDDNTGSGTNDAKTRAQKVTYTITGLDKIAIPELNLAEAKPFVIKASDPDAENKKSLTITVGTKKIILVPTADASNFAADSSPADVVTAFNDLTGAPKWDENAAKNTYWKITKYNGKAPGKKGSTPKEFYMVFDNAAANKVRFGSTVGTEKKKYANADKEDWTVKAILGGMQVSITVDTNKIVLTDKTFTLTGTGTNQIITVDGGTVFTQVSTDPLNSHTDGTVDVKTALGKFADNE